MEYDRNGFLVRPALIGDVRPHAIKVGYLGFNGDGHLGRLESDARLLLCVWPRRSKSDRRSKRASAFKHGGAGGVGR